MIDVSVMSNEELSKIITEAKAELEQREYVEKERAWDRVRDAIADYLDKYERIEITDPYDSLILEKGNIDSGELGIFKIFGY